MNPSAFDPQTFLDATIDKPSVKRPPLPAANPASGDGLYIGIIGELKSRAWQGKSDPSKSGIALDVPIQIDVPAELQQSMQLPPQVTLTDGIMLDLTPQGLIDNAPGKNRRLRLYREATDMNKPGDVFSPRKLVGRMVKVKVKHDLYEGELYDKVDLVFKG